MEAASRIKAAVLMRFMDAPSGVSRIRSPALPVDTAREIAWAVIFGTDTERSIL
jgi:hypothetical protein